MKVQSAIKFIRMTVRVCAVYPMAIALGLVLAGSGFSLKSVMVEFYSYVSSISQVAAESPKHINQIVCVEHSAASPTNEPLPPKVICEKWETRSVLIEDAAEQSANDFIRLYGLFVFIALGVELAVIFFRSKSTTKNDPDQSGSVVQKM